MNVLEKAGICCISVNSALLWKIAPVKQKLKLVVAVEVRRSTLS